MCDLKFVPKAVNLTKKVALSLRTMFRKKEEATAAFDFLSPPKKTEQAEHGKACPAA